LADRGDALLEARKRRFRVTDDGWELQGGDGQQAHGPVLSFNALERTLSDRRSRCQPR
jgi:hypothetical protein